VISKKGIVLVVSILTSLILSMTFQDVWAGPNIVLNPNRAQRNIGGKIWMHIMLDSINGSPLLSTGIKISFNPSYLQVIDAQKYVAGKWEVWAMKDPTSGTTYTDPPIQVDNTNGTVTIIGGKLKPNPVIGNNILIGYIVFRCIAGSGGHVTKTPITVGLAHPTPYNNFVREDGTVDDATMNINTPQQLATICIIDSSKGVPACEGDLNADNQVFGADYSIFNGSWLKWWYQSGYNPGADFNADGQVFGPDYSIFNGDWLRGRPGQIACPSCWP